MRKNAYKKFLAKTFQPAITPKRDGGSLSSLITGKRISNATCHGNYKTCITIQERMSSGGTPNIRRKKIARVKKINGKEKRKQSDITNLKKVYDKRK